MSADPSRARELQEAAAEVTALRDLLTDLWNHARPRGEGAYRMYPMGALQERLWAQVEAVVHEGDYGWDRSLTLEDLSRRISKLEKMLLNA